jgi:hypothetical protein
MVDDSIKNLIAGGLVYRERGFDTILKLELNLLNDDSTRE